MKLKVLDAAEKANIAMSADVSTQIVIDELIDDIDFDEELERENLN